MDTNVSENIESRAGDTGYASNLARLLKSTYTKDKKDALNRRNAHDDVANSNSKVGRIGLGESMVGRVAH